MRRTRKAACGLLMAGVLMGMVMATSGCAGARISLGTGESACFRALPPAEAAVHSKGKLVGVRQVSAATLMARLAQLRTLTTLRTQTLCVFAFSGTYPPGSVAGAHNTITRHYAVIAVGSKHTEVVAAFALDQLPTRFRHTH